MEENILEKILYKKDYLEQYFPTNKVGKPKNKKKRQAAKAARKARKRK